MAEAEAVKGVAAPSIAACARFCFGLKRRAYLVDARVLRSAHAEQPPY
jgi:hypothetical protein